MASVKVIHLLKRVENIDREVAELHGLVDGIDSSRSYRNTLKIAAEQQINNLIGERVKLMELNIENPPAYLTDQVYPVPQVRPVQPRITLDDLLGETNGTFNKSTSATQVMTYNDTHGGESVPQMTRQSDIERSAPKDSFNAPLRQRRIEKNPIKSRADILRDLPPLQY